MRFQNRHGFTYIELMITIGILGMVMLVISNFTSTTLQTWRQTREQVQLQERVRNSLASIVEEIREMQTSESGAYAIESASQTSLTFFANIDSDSDRERARYFWEDNSIKRAITEPVGSSYPTENTPEVVAEDIYLDGDLFTYYDSSYTGTEPALTYPLIKTDIHLIQIHFLIDTDPTQIPEAVEMTTQVTPRNLKEYAPTP